MFRYYMGKKNYMALEDTPTDYGQVEYSPKDSLTKGALLSYIHPKKGYYQAHKERNDYRKRVMDMANDVENTILIRPYDIYGIEGAIDEFKRKEKQDKTDNFRKKQKTRTENKYDTMVKSSTAAKSRNIAKGVKRTRHKHKKIGRTTRKHRRGTHRRH
jgi:hypothetical protein